MPESMAAGAYGTASESVNLTVGDSGAYANSQSTDAPLPPQLVPPPAEKELSSWADATAPLPDEIVYPSLQPPVSLSHGAALQQRVADINYGTVDAPIWDLNHSNAKLKADLKRFVQFDEAAGKIVEFPLGMRLGKLGHLGVGVGLFLRFMKVVGLMTVALAVLSVPAIVVFSMGTARTSSVEMLSMGNLGSAEPPAWLAVFDLVGALVFCFLLLHYRYRSQKTVIRISACTILASNFSVHVKHLPKGATDPVALAQFFSRYGEVVSVGISLNFHELHECLEREKELKLKLYQFEGARRLRRSYFSFWPEVDYQDELRRVGERISYLRSKIYSCTGHAYVTFMFESAKNACLVDLDQNRTAGWLTNVFGPASNRRPEFMGKLITATDAEEPSDVVWKNLGCSSFVRFFRVMFSVMITISLIAINFGIVYGLETLRLQQNDNAAVLVVIALAVVLLNKIHEAILEWLTKLEKFPSHSERQRSLLWRVVASQFLNTAGIILAVHSPLSHSFFEDASEPVLSIVLIQLAVDFVTNLCLKLTEGSLQAVAASRAFTQQTLEQAYEKPEFSVAQRYSFWIRTFLVSLLFASLFPVTMPPTAVSFFLGYFVDKFNILRVFARPAQLSAVVSSGALHFVSLGYCLRSGVTLLALQGRYQTLDSGYAICTFFTLGLGLFTFLCALSFDSHATEMRKRRYILSTGGQPFTNFRLPIYQPPLITLQVMSYNCNVPSQTQALWERLAAANQGVGGAVQKTVQSFKTTTNAVAASSKRMWNRYFARGNKTVPPQEHQQPQQYQQQQQYQPPPPQHQQQPSPAGPVVVVAPAAPARIAGPPLSGGFSADNPYAPAAAREAAPSGNPNPYAPPAAMPSSSSSSSSAGAGIGARETANPYAQISPSAGHPGSSNPYSAI